MTRSPDPDTSRILVVLATVSRALALAVTLVLATYGSFVLGFGVINECTNVYYCSSSWCDPCAAANVWLTTGWIVQGLLLVAAFALLLPWARRLRRATALGLGLATTVVSILAFAGTAWAADQSYCQPGGPPAVTGEPNLCDV